MKNLIDTINEGNGGLPNLPKLKKNPEWISSYPDFKEKMEEIWDDDKLFASTLMYFINGEFDDNSSLSDYKIGIHKLYHK